VTITMKQKLIFLSALMAVGTASYAKITVDPSSAATFTMAKGYEKSKLLGGNTQLVFMAKEAGSCKGLKYAFGFNWSDKNGSIQTKQLPAGKPLTLYALAKINTNGGYAQVTENRCARTVVFTPAIGGKYTLIQKIDLAVPCDISVIDDATGKPPPEIVSMSSRACGGYI
jgi:hypothetical protein